MIHIIENSYVLARLYNNPNESYATRPPEFITYEYIRVCVDSRQVFVKGKEIDIKREEFDVLCPLMRNKGKVLTYEEILRKVWGEDYFDNVTNRLSCIIRRIKNKLSIEPRTRNYIKNKHPIVSYTDNNRRNRHDCCNHAGFYLVICVI